MGERKDAGPGVDWRAELVYPGLRRGEKLRRETSLPPRATIEARDGTPLAKGPDRVSDLGPIASDLAGTIGPAPETRAAELQARGVPDGAAVGLTGLEREFDERLTGTPGGVLFAGNARAGQRQGQGGQRGAHDDRPEDPARRGRGAGRPLRRDRGRPARGRRGAGAGRDRLQRAAAARLDLQDRHARGRPAEQDRQAQVDLPDPERGDDRGRRDRQRQRRVLRRLARDLLRALLQQRLRAAGRQARRGEARRDGARSSASTRSRRSPARRAARSPPPPRSATTSPSARPRSARARCSRPRCRWRRRRDDRRRRRARAARRCSRATTRRRVRATSKSVARTIKSYMRTVVTDGTGGAAALDGIKVSGKTGTAELRTTVKEEPPPEVTDPNQPPPEDDTTDTDAWFVAFAPYRKPTIAVSVMLVGQGAGGDTAAPAAGVVLKAAARPRDRGRSSPRSSSPPCSISSLSGRFCSASVLSRKRISEPWIGPLDAAVSGRGQDLRVPQLDRRHRRTGWTRRRAGRAGTRPPRCPRS